MSASMISEPRIYNEKYKEMAMSTQVLKALLKAKKKPKEPTAIEENIMTENQQSLNEDLPNDGDNESENESADEVNQLQVANESLNEARSEVEAMRANLNANNECLNLTIFELKDTQNALEKASREISILKNQFQEVNEKLQISNEHLIEERKTVADTKKAVERLSNDLIKAENESKMVFDDLEKSKKELMEAKKQLNKKDNSIRELNRTTDDQLEKIKVLAQKETYLEQNLKSLQKEHTQIQQENIEISQHLQMYKSSGLKQKEVIEELRKLSEYQENTLQTQINNLIIENNEIKDHNNKLETECRNLQPRLEALQSDLETIKMEKIELDANLANAIEKNRIREGELSRKLEEERLENKNLATVINKSANEAKEKETNLEKTIENIKVKVETLNHDLIETRYNAEMEKVAMEETIKKASEEKELKNLELRKMKLDISDLEANSERKLKLSQNEITLLKTKKDQIQDDFRNIQSVAEKYNCENHVLRTKVSELENQVKLLRLENSHLEIQKRESDAVFLEMESQIDSFQEQLKSTTIRETKFIEDIKKVTESLDEQRKQNEEHKRKVGLLNNEIKHLKHLLEQKEKEYSKTVGIYNQDIESRIAQFKEQLEEKDKFITLMEEERRISKVDFENSLESMSNEYKKNNQQLMSELDMANEERLQIRNNCKKEVEFIKCENERIYKINKELREQLGRINDTELKLELAELRESIEKSIISNSSSQVNEASQKTIQDLTDTNKKLIQLHGQALGILQQTQITSDTRGGELRSLMHQYDSLQNYVHKSCFNISAIMDGSAQ